MRPRLQTCAIGELAQHFDVTTRTIRFYEQEGLLSPERRGKTRVYHEKDRVRLKLALRSKRLGFSLLEIREVLDLYDTRHDGSFRQLERYLDQVEERYKRELENRMEINFNSNECLCIHIDIIHVKRLYRPKK